nr:helix-turn-helix domain-containing protein [Cryobacterium psychrotolerans]
MHGGRSPALSPTQQKHLVELHAAGLHSIAELAELFAVGRATGDRAIDRAAAANR